MNDPKDKDLVNVVIDSNLRVIALRDIKKGEELLVSYGRGYWSVMDRQM